MEKYTFVIDFFKCSDAVEEKSLEIWEKSGGNVDIADVVKWAISEKLGVDEKDLSISIY